MAGLFGALVLGLTALVGPGGWPSVAIALDVRR